MHKTKDKVADVAGTARPYVERALHDEELRDHVKMAYSAAREIYDELVGPRGVTHVVECGPRLFIESAARSVMGGQDQRIEDGFGSARLDGFVGVMIAVVGSGLFPKAYTRGDIVQESAFGVGRSVIRPLTEGRAGKGVRQRRMA